MDNDWCSICPLPAVQISGFKGEGDAEGEGGWVGALSVPFSLATVGVATTAVAVAGAAVIRVAVLGGVGMG